MSEKASASVCTSAAPDTMREVKHCTLVGLFTNLVLTAFKIVAGYFGGSQAVVADGIHSLSDSGTDIVVLVGAHFWGQPPDENHPYGHRKVESIATLVIGLPLGLLGIGLAYNAIVNLQEKHESPPALIALVAAVLSIIVKEALYQWTIRVGKQIKSSAVIANAWHHRSDALSSIPVSVAVATSLIAPTWSFVDHVATVAVSLFILQTTWTIISPPLQDLIERGADQSIVDRIYALSMQVDGVKDVHKIRSRSVAGAYFIDLHVMVEKTLNIDEAHNISGRVKKLLLNAELDIVDVLVHIEPYQS